MSEWRCSTCPLFQPLLGECPRWGYIEHPADSVCGLPPGWDKGAERRERKSKEKPA